MKKAQQNSLLKYSLFPLKLLGQISFLMMGGVWLLIDVSIRKLTLKHLLPLLVMGGGLGLWGWLLEVWDPLRFQSKALLSFILSLTLLSCLWLSLKSHLLEIIKITAYLLFFVTFILAFEPFYHLLLEGKALYAQLKYEIPNPPEKALGLLFRWGSEKLTKNPEFYGTWGGICLMPLLLLTYFFHLLCLVPGRRLFLDRAYRVKEGPWTAGFLEKQKEAELLANKTGYPLGVPLHKNGSHGPLLRYKPNPQLGWLGGHHMVISGSQGGKGVSCVLPALLDHEGPIAVLDIKGELFAMTQRERQRKGRKVVVLNPFEVVQGKGNKIEEACRGEIQGETQSNHLTSPPKAPQWQWNPLSYIRPEEFERDVQIIIEGLLEPETPYNQHFYKMAADILKVSIEVMARTLPKSQFTLPTLYDFVCGPGFIPRLHNWKKKPEFLEGRPAKIAAILLETGQEERGSFLTTIKRNLSWIGYEKTKTFLEPELPPQENEKQKKSKKSEKSEKSKKSKKSEKKKCSPSSTPVGFSFDELLENKVDIFCVIPLDMIETMAGFLRLFTNIVLGTVIRQSGYKNPQEKILLMLDEFPRLGALRQLINIVTVAAGAGIEAFMVAQDKSSIESVWGKETDVLFGSSATVRVFNLGRTDSSTASWASNLLGDKTVITRTNAAREYGDFLKGAGSESVSQVKERLLTASQIQELSSTKMLCFIRGKKPLLLERIISHEHPFYKQRLDPNPTLLGSQNNPLSSEA